MQAQKEGKFYKWYVSHFNFTWNLIVYALVHFLSAYYSIQFFRINSENISFFWPSAGLTLAALFLVPKKRWSIILATQISISIIANMINGVAAGPSIAFAFIDAISYFLIAIIFEAQLPDFFELKSLTVIRNFFFLTTAIAIITSLPAAVMVQYYYGDDIVVAGSRYFISMLISWWVVTPFFVNYSKAPPVEDEDIPIWRNGNIIGQWFEYLVYSFLVIGTAVYVFLIASPTPGAQTLVRSYILFPLFFPVASRFRVHTLGLLVLLVSLISLIGTTLGLGEFSLPGNLLGQNLATAQFFVMALAFSTYIMRISLRRIRFTRERLARSTKEILSTFDTATVGILHADLDGKIIRMNKAMYQMLGYDDETSVSQSPAEAPINIFLDEDNALAYKNNFPDHKVWGGQLLDLRSKTGESVHVYLTAHREEDEFGQPFMQIFVNDVTEQMDAVRKLRENELRLRLATDATLTGLWEYDIPNHILTANTGMLSLLGRTVDEFPRTFHGLLELTHPDDQEDLAAAAEGLAANLSGFIDVEARLQINPQGWRWLHIKGRIFENSSGGQFTRMLGSAVDITNLKMTKQALHTANDKLQKQLDDIKTMQTRLEQKAARDPLTNLYNRWFFDEAIVREAYRADQESGTFGILLIDVDDYTMVVDSVGKQKGGQVLLLLSEILGKHFRGSDFPCRMDADNFSVILSGGDPLSYAKRAAEVISFFEAQAFNAVGLSLTISGGLAVYPQNGSSAKVVFDAAEGALLEARRSGQNKLIQAK